MILGLCLAATLVATPARAETEAFLDGDQERSAGLLNDVGQAPFVSSTAVMATLAPLILGTTLMLAPQFLAPGTLFQGTPQGTRHTTMFFMGATFALFGTGTHYLLLSDIPAFIISGLGRCALTALTVLGVGGFAFVAPVISIFMFLSGVGSLLGWYIYDVVKATRASERWLEEHCPLITEAARRSTVAPPAQVALASF